MNLDALIVGAGLAGLAAAARIQQAGRSLALLEKSRGPSGRAATRRHEGMPVDHGAQFFTVRDPQFRNLVDGWIDDGTCFVWAHGFHQWNPEGLSAPSMPGHARLACRTGMASLGRRLAEGLGGALHLGEHAVTLSAAKGGWEVRTRSGRIYHARQVLLTPPAPQAAALAGPAHPEAGSTLSRRAFAPCLAVVLRFPRFSPPWQGIQCHDHPVLSWVGHDTSKRPAAHPEATVLVTHATPSFSRAHLDNADDPVPEVLAALREVAGVEIPRPEGFFVHRWRYALCPSPAEHPPFLAWKTPAPLLAAGDALAGGRIEGAWISGHAAGEQMVRFS